MLPLSVAEKYIKDIFREGDSFPDYEILCAVIRANQLGISDPTSLYPDSINRDHYTALCSLARHLALDRDQFDNLLSLDTVGTYPDNLRDFVTKKTSTAIPTAHNDIMQSVLDIIAVHLRRTL